ncbi:DUF1330 domain-containing protein [Vibrio gallicus]|uniref:DUF1330 domain-containing protein n=1 Tax=Vibrio gallicus TaxID=190897 RepID=UPI0021C26387|nr:DUF1330 domain-containing protein [Vibrio gallicus]
MAFYSVLEVSPTSDSWGAEYAAASGAIVAKHGGKYIARTTNHMRLEGEGEDPIARVILWWPSKEAALAFMNDPEYAPHLKARTEGSISHHVLIEGLE